MGRKVFLSVLGTGPYEECEYVSGDYSMKSRYIQVATLAYLEERLKSENNGFSESDAAIIFVTNKSELQQWNIGLTKAGKSTGLREELKKLNLPMKIRSRHIDDGKNEAEIWTIFKTIFDEIQEDDELYFDVTHAFRYLPMLLLTLINYSKFLKNVKLKSITYGNFMVEGDKKPIMDLTAISALQDWTFAAGEYLKHGDADDLVRLGKDEIKPILKATKGKDEAASELNHFIELLQRVVDSFRTCRGIQIIDAIDLSRLKKATEKLDSTMIEPLNPIFDKIKNSLDQFDELKNVRNAYSAAIWCFDNKLYQQSATILQEYVISFLCLRNGINIEDDKQRECVNMALIIKKKEIDEKEWECDEEQKAKIKEILHDDLLNNKDFVSLFSTMTSVRNDYNHSGMRQETQAPKSLIVNIRKCIDKFGEILLNEDPEKPCPVSQPNSFN